MEVTSYSELIAGINAQREALGVRLVDFDELAGFPAGLAGKVFGPSQVKRLGPEKMFDAMRAAGLRIRLEPDPEQIEKMKMRIAENFNPRQANQARPANYASPMSTHQLSRVFKHLSRLGAKGRMRKMTKAQRSAHARHAAIERWKKYRKRQKAAHRRRLKDATKREGVE
jgi:hypothetical protein